MRKEKISQKELEKQDWKEIACTDDIKVFEKGSRELIWDIKTQVVILDYGIGQSS